MNDPGQPGQPRQPGQPGRPAIRSRHPILVAVFALPAVALITIRALAGSVAETLRDPTTRGIGIVAIGVVVVATFFFNWVEGWGLLNSLYFSVITLATVGYGDFTPTTDLGKVGAIVMVLFGVGIIAAFFGTIARRAGARAASREAVIRQRFAERAARAELAAETFEAAALEDGAGRSLGLTGADGAADEGRRHAPDP